MKSKAHEAELVSTEETVSRVEAPILTPLPETEQSQVKGGVRISLVPIQYEVRREQVIFDEPAEDPLWGMVTKEGHEYVERIRTYTLRVYPSTLSFLVTINNQLPRVFRGAGAVVQFNVCGRLIGVRSEWYATLSNSIVPPRTEIQVQISGPSLTAIDAPCPVGVFIYDVVTDRDDAGVATKRQNFEWYYNYAVEVRQERVPVTREKTWVPVSDLRLRPVDVPPPQPAVVVVPVGAGDVPEAPNPAGLGVKAGDEGGARSNEGTVDAIGAETPLLRVIVEQANVRLEPDGESTIVEIVRAGMVLELLGEEGNWYKVLNTMTSLGMPDSYRVA